MLVDSKAKIFMRHRLLCWFAANRRFFPWREATDSFSILMAEKLLQQTAATSSVVRAYELLTTVYPTPKHIVNAKPSALSEIFGPLGFAYRADELRKLSEALLEHFGGVVPSRLEELLSLPGIGDYSARAILCFAYGQETAVVDVNVARVIYRFLGIKKTLPPNPARNKFILSLAQEILPRGRDRAKSFNWAMLDLGATVCTARRPKCLTCPLMRECQTGKHATLAEGV